METLSATQTAWEPGMTVQIGATYRHRSTGQPMRLTCAEATKNRVALAATNDPMRWEGTSQRFAETFEFDAPYSPDAKAAPVSFVPPWLLKQTFAVQHSPNCPSPFLVRLVTPGTAHLDHKQYHFKEDCTQDTLGFGQTLQEAADAARTALASRRPAPRN